MSGSGDKDHRAIDRARLNLASFLVLELASRPAKGLKSLSSIALRPLVVPSAIAGGFERRSPNHP